LNGCLLGTKKHLLVRDDTYQWIEEVPDDAWHLSGRLKDDSDRCYDTVLKLAGRQLDLLPPQPFVKQMEVFADSLGEQPISWQRVMPVRAHRLFVKNLVERVMVTPEQSLFNYYTTVWVPGNHIIRSLQRCKVDQRTWQVLVDENTGNVPAVKSFQPDARGYAQSIVYDRFKTLTGRLVVHSGPQILTLKREHRKMLRSVHGDNGTIVAVDFAALEARVLLYEYGRRCEDVDLYGMIARELNYDRKAVKIAVISELYGSGERALGQRLGIEGRELDDFVKRIKAYFNTSELLARIKPQFLATGKVINRHGRPVTIDEPIDSKLIAYYGQSTGVDITMLGFHQVITALAERAPRARPVFLLHDSLLLDVHREDMQIVRSISSLRVPGYVQHFLLRFEHVAGVEVC